MEFLAPFFAVAGAVAAGVPLVLHLLRRAPAQQMPFSLVRFLNPAGPKFTRRSTIEHWPLLLLRILALVLLGLAFARPFHRSAEWIASQQEYSRRVTLLIDRSASMRQIGIRDAVLREVRSVVEGLSETDRLRVAMFSNTVETVVDSESWTAFSAGEKAAAIERLLNAYTPDWHGTHTGIALQQATDELMQESDPDTKHQIVLITDFQEGSDFTSLQSDAWPKSVEVALRIVKAEQPGNASLHTLIDRRTGQTLVRISNGVDATVTDFRIRPVDKAGLPVGTPVPVEVLPGGQVSLPMTAFLSLDAVDSLSLVDDPHSFDNLLPLPMVSPLVSRIAHAGSTDVNDSDRMRYYLQRALDSILSESDDEESRLEIFDVVTADGLVLPIPDDIDLAILTDAVPAELISSLTALLDRGGLVVAALNSPAMAASVAALLPEGLTIREARVDDYAMLGRIDFEHPLFADFSDARFADFSSIRFWKHRSIEFAAPAAGDTSADRPLSWNVIARFDTGFPAIVRIRHASPWELPSTTSKPRGEGRSSLQTWRSRNSPPALAQGELYLLASGWHPDDSQWALSSRFAPMLARFLHLASPREAEHRHVLVGDSFDPAELVGSADWQMRLPDGTTLDSQDQVDSHDATAFFTINQPGRYAVQSHSEEKPPVVTVLAEIHPDESRTATLPAGQLYALGLTGNDTSTSTDNSVLQASVSRQATAAQLESRQKYWRWFLLAGLGCLVVEALLGAVIHRRQPETA